MDLADVIQIGPIPLPEVWRPRLERGELIVEALPLSGERAPGVFIQALFHCPPGRVWDILIDYHSLSDAIYGVSSAEVIEGGPGDAYVCFRMRLPIPFGRIAWVNQVRAVEHAGLYVFSWKYIEGDLKTNEGWLAMANDGDLGERTYARYHVRVETGRRVPRSAERVARRWLLPRVVMRLRSVAEARAR